MPSHYERYEVDPVIDTYSHCCKGSPIGTCVLCGHTVCQFHGVYLDRSKEEVACCECEEARLDQHLNDNDLDGPRGRIVLTPFQVAMFLDMWKAAVA